MVAPSRRVLVTGARGFTGAHLRRELEAHGYIVVGLVHESAAGPDECFADLTDARAVREAVYETVPDFVIHLAAISFVGHDELDELYTTNVLGTVNLLEALRTAPIQPRRVIVASSANIYGEVRVDMVDETHPPRPANHYAASKVASEAAAHVYRDDLSITITRPFNYTGPGQSPRFLVPKLVDHFARRAPRIELGNLDVERDFLDVRTIVEVYRALLDCDAARSQVVNLCSGRGVSLGDMITKLQQLTGHTIAVDVNPAFVRANEIKRLVGSSERLTSLIGPLAERSFDQTLRDMLAAAGTIT